MESRCIIKHKSHSPLVRVRASLVFFLSHSRKTKTNTYNWDLDYYIYKKCLPGEIVTPHCSYFSCIITQTLTLSSAWREKIQIKKWSRRLKYILYLVHHLRVSPKISREYKHEWMNEKSEMKYSRESKCEFHFSPLFKQEVNEKGLK